MKTTERLLCACSLWEDAETGAELRELLTRCAARIFSHAAEYAGKLLAAVRAHLGLDLGQSRFEADGKTWLCAGEASREPFLFALIWWHLFRGQPFEAIPYERYLDY